MGGQKEPLKRVTEMDGEEQSRREQLHAELAGALDLPGTTESQLRQAEAYWNIVTSVFPLESYRSAEVLDIIQAEACEILRQNRLSEEDYPAPESAHGICGRVLDLFHTSRALGAEWEKTKSAGASNLDRFYQLAVELGATVALLQSLLDEPYWKAMQKGQSKGGISRAASFNEKRKQYQLKVDHYVNTGLSYDRACQYTATELGVGKSTIKKYTLNPKNQK